jgi:hypothetical protein
MRDVEFDAWLKNEYVGRNGVGLGDHDRASRLWLARRIEQYEGDLDEHYATDSMLLLLERLVYAYGDSVRAQAPRHAIPIERNAYKMTANLRHAASLYLKFRQGAGVPTPSENEYLRAPRVRRSVVGQHDWPTWEQPTEAAILALAHMVTPLIRFLHPQIVLALVEDNGRERAAWQATLGARGINTDDYLWLGSATAFPGVRRYAGKAELRRFQQDHGMDMEGVLRLDDNHYPKQIWSFTLRGRPFQNFGPDGYQLAHLVDHKAYDHRGAEELVGSLPENVGSIGIPGLFTSVTNAAYVPTTFLRPTDFSGLLRNLLQRRAAELYGCFCRLLPGELEFKRASSPAWETSAFTWSDPVGTTDHLTAFLDFRRTELQRLFDERQP